MDGTYEPAGFCPHCGYRVDAGVCAECGKRVSRPVRRDPRWRLWLMRWIVRLSVVAAVGGLAVMAAVRWVPNETLWVLSGRDGDPIPEFVMQVSGAVLDWRREVDLADAESAIERIGRQLADAPEHAWAGTYLTAGGPEARRVYLSPTLEYASWQSLQCCCEDSLAASYGSIIGLTDRQLQVRPSGYRVDDDPARPVLTFERLRWGDRSCLLDAEILLSDATESITFDSLLWELAVRADESSGPLDGWPELPVEVREKFAGFPPTLVVLGAYETLEPFEELDEALGDADYEQTVLRTVCIDLVGDWCLPDTAMVTGLYANLPSAYAFRKGRVLRVQEYPSDDFPLPAVGWRFAVDAQEWDEDQSHDDEEADADVASAGDGEHAAWTHSER